MQSTSRERWEGGRNDSSVEEGAATTRREEMIEGGDRATRGGGAIVGEAEGDIPGGETGKEMRGRESDEEGILGRLQRAVEDDDATQFAKAIVEWHRGDANRALDFLARAFLSLRARESGAVHLGPSASDMLIQLLNNASLATGSPESTPRGGLVRGDSGTSTTMTSPSRASPVVMGASSTSTTPTGSASTSPNVFSPTRPSVMQAFSSSGSSLFGQVRPLALDDEIDERPATLVMLVPAASVRHLIGKQGANVGKLEREYGVSIKVERLVAQVASGDLGMGTGGAGGGGTEVGPMMMMMTTTRLGTGGEFMGLTPLLQPHHHGSPPPQPRQLLAPQGSGGGRRPAAVMEPTMSVASLMEERRVYIKGTVRGVSLSHRSISRTVMECVANMRESKIYVPNDYVSRLIGKGGINVNKLRTSSGAAISIQDEVSWNVAYDAPSRLVTLRGDEQSRMNAQYFISREMAKEEKHTGWEDKVWRAALTGV